MDDKTHFLVNCGGRLRKVFSVIEKADGETYLVANHAEHFGLEPQKPTPIKQQRHSIHPTSKSAEYTMVKQTMEWGDNGGKTTVSLSDAIKRRSGFAPIFVRRVPDLSHERYAADEKDTRMVEITNLDPTTEMFFYGIFLSHSSVSFSLQPTQPVELTQWASSECRVVILSAKLPLPSHPTGEYLHAYTQPPEMGDTPDARAKMRALMTGVSEKECVEIFTDYSRRLAMAFVFRRLAEEVVKPNNEANVTALSKILTFI